MTQRYECEAVLFDLDGVLVDSTGLVDKVWRAWAAERDLDADEVMKVAHGRPAAEIIAEFTPHLSPEKETEVLEQREIEEGAAILAIPGAAALLGALEERKWAIVTSGTHPLASSRLQSVGHPTPESLVTASSITHGKPHPEGYLRAAHMLGVEPAACVVFEDAPAGIEAARAAGMRVIGLTTTFEAGALEGADAIVSSLEQVQVAAATDDGPEIVLLVDA